MVSKNGRIVAVWGSTGSGKTTLSSQLALGLAEKKKDVIIVYTDIITPVIPVLMPELKEQKSMEHLWSNPDCSSDLILNSCVITKSQHICLLGYKATENVFSQQDYVKENVYKVYMELKDLADYVIVDCVSYFPYNMLSTVALEAADNVIRLSEATLKSYSYFDSNLSALVESKYDTDEHIRVLSKVKSFQPKELAATRLSTAYQLPYNEEIERMMLSGTLLQTRIEGTYRKEMNKLLTVLMEGDLDE